MLVQDLLSEAVNLSFWLPAELSDGLLEFGLFTMTLIVNKTPFAIEDISLENKVQMITQQ